MNTNDAIAFGMSMVFLLTIIPIVGGFMYARRGLLLTHAERMKALELGAELPDHAAAARIRAALVPPPANDDGGPESLARKCFSTALWVAFWGFAAAAGLGGADVGAGSPTPLHRQPAPSESPPSSAAPSWPRALSQPPTMQTTMPSLRPRTPTPSTSFLAEADTALVTGEWKLTHGSAERDI